MPGERPLVIDVPGHGTVTGVLAPPAGAPRWALTLSHGAGGTLASTFPAAARRGLAARGALVLAHNFPFSEQGRSRPDPSGTLEATVRAAAARLREHPAASGLPVVLSGKSLGGRIASMVVADGAPADGLVFFGYPLHPPGRTESLRTGHWAALRVPALFLQGTRDPFGEPELLRRELTRYAGSAEVAEIAGGGHSFNVPRASPVQQAAVLQELWDLSAAWLARRWPSG